MEFEHFRRIPTVEQNYLVLTLLLDIQREMKHMANTLDKAANALADLTAAVATDIDLRQQANQLEQTLITDLQTEIALLQSNPSGVDPTKVEAIVGQLASGNAAQQTAIANMQAAINSLNPPTQPATSTVNLTLPAEGPASTSLAFSGSVTPGTPVGTATPTGTVVITDATGALSTSATLDSSGNFSSTVSAGLPAGTYNVTANYSGDSKFAASSVTGSLVVDAASNPAPATGAGATGATS